MYRILRFVVVSLGLLSFVASPVRGGDCVYKCERTTDTATCISIGPTSRAASDCQPIQNCVIAGWIKVENGGVIPVFACSYSCQLTYSNCVWV